MFLESKNVRIELVQEALVKKLLIVFISTFIANQALAIMEFDFDFSYEKNRFGEDRQNKSVSRDYGASIAFYFFNLTAIEFNYTEGSDKTIVNHDTSNATNLVIESQTSTIERSSYGIGLKQAFAGQNSFLIPTLSLGWARQKVSDGSTATILNKTNNDRTIYEDPGSSVSYDSVFAAFALKIRLTKTMALKGSVKTSFQAFEWNEAKDQVQYSTGLSWIF